MYDSSFSYLLSHIYIFIYEVDERNENENEEEVFFPQNMRIFARYKRE